MMIVIPAKLSHFCEAPCRDPANERRRLDFLWLRTCCPWVPALRA